MKWQLISLLLHQNFTSGEYWKGAIESQLKTAKDFAVVFELSSKAMQIWSCSLLNKNKELQKYCIVFGESRSLHWINPTGFDSIVDYGIVASLIAIAIECKALQIHCTCLILAGNCEFHCPFTACKNFITYQQVIRCAC